MLATRSTAPLPSIVDLTKQQRSQDRSLDVVVAGSLAIDLSSDYNPTHEGKVNVTMNTSNPAIITQKLGGVGHNVALAAHYSGAKTQLCSIVADDIAGNAVLGLLQGEGLSTDGIHVVPKNANTAQYVALNDSGKELVVAMADMRILEGGGDDFHRAWKSKIASYTPKWVVVDANWDKQMIKRWVDAGLALGAKIAFEPVSVEKSTRIFYKTWLDSMNSLIQSAPSGKTAPGAWSANQLADLATPNELELTAMAQQLNMTDAWISLLTSFQENLLLDRIHSLNGGSLRCIGEAVLLAALKLLSNIPCVLTKLGSKGVLLTEVLQADDARLQSDDEARYMLFRKEPTVSKHDQSISLPHTEPKSSLSKIGGVYVRWFPAVEAIAEEDMISVNGAGDTFMGVLIASMAKSRDTRSVSDFVDAAQRAAVLTLKSTESVSPKVRDIFRDVD